MTLITKRPVLNRKISIDDFTSFYWYKKELAKFCVENGIPSIGQKLELYERIKHFLITSTLPDNVFPDKKQHKKRNGALTPSTPVDEHFRCNEETRLFFKSIIGNHFHFTAHLQAHIKANKNRNLTYGDLVKEWKAEFERRKDKKYKPAIMKSCEYNQFVRDYLSDVLNKGHSIKEAAVAWKKIRTNKGPRTYKEYKKKFVS